MRPPAFKILTLALTVFLLLSFTLSAFALPMRYWLATRDLDEQPWPGAVGNSSYFVVVKTAYGFVIMPVFVKLNKASNSSTQQKPNPSSGKNEVAE